MFIHDNVESADEDVLLEGKVILARKVRDSKFELACSYFEIKFYEKFFALCSKEGYLLNGYPWVREKGRRTGLWLITTPARVQLLTSVTANDKAVEENGV